MEGEVNLMGAGAVLQNPGPRKQQAARQAGRPTFLTAAPPPGTSCLSKHHRMAEPGREVGRLERKKGGQSPGQEAIIDALCLLRFPNQRTQSH